jgi:hypothetical protein
MLNSIINIIRSDDFIQELESQFKNYFLQEIGAPLPSNFNLILDSYKASNPQLILADLICPDNLGHPIEIKWEIDGNQFNDSNFDKSKGKIKFTFYGLPMDIIKKFLEPNKSLPFTVEEYKFDFFCYHFHGFKDVKFEFEVSSDHSKEIQDVVRATARKWNEININNTVDFVGNIQKIENNKYEIFIDLGPANRYFIGLVLNEINNEPFASKIDIITLR